jgi:formyltetrahydrofolate deformylase
MHKDVALVSCPDQPGLIHQLTGVMLSHRLNITETKEFVDHTVQRFFMRIQFEGEVEGQALESQMRKILPKPAFCQVRRLEARRLVVLASKEPHCVGDLLLRYSTGNLFGEILAVVSQHEDCRQLVERFDLPFHFVPVKNLSREDHEKEIIKIADPLKPDYLILARYMRIFTPLFVNHYAGRLMNIHHSFLPAFIGKNPYEQAYARGVKIIGATAHFVTENLDEGPIITQSVLHVNHGDDPEEMARRGQDVEKIVLARATELVLEDRVLIDGHRTIIFD